MLTAELVDFMVDFVINPDFVIVRSIVLDSIIGKIFGQLVNNLNSLELYQNSTTGTTWDVFHHIGLNGHLSALYGGDKWNHEMETRL